MLPAWLMGIVGLMYSGYQAYTLLIDTDLFRRPKSAKSLVLSNQRLKPCKLQQHDCFAILYLSGVYHLLCLIQ